MTNKMAVFFAGVLALFAGLAGAEPFEDNFEDPNWADRWFFRPALYGQTETVVDDGTGNKALQLTTTTVPPNAGPESAAFCDNGRTYFVDNLRLQTDILVPAGSGGGGVFWGYELSQGNEYYLVLAPELDLIQISEEPYAPGLSLVGNASLPLEFDTWYTVKVVSTGTSFEVWLGLRGEPLVQRFNVPQDGNHPGYQSHVRGQCGLFSENSVAPAPGPVLFDNFSCDGVLTPPETTFADDFEDSSWTGANWAAVYGPTIAYEPALNGQGVRIAQPGSGPGGMFADNGSLFFADRFTMRCSVNLDQTWHGGFAFAVEGTGAQFTDYYLFMGHDYNTGMVRFKLAEQLGAAESTLAAIDLPEVPETTWYHLEFEAGVPDIIGEAFFRLYAWPHGSSKPAEPVWTVRQDYPHIGYRLVNLGGFGMYQNSGHSGLYDDYELIATPVPASNTAPGENVEVTVESDSGPIDISFGEIVTAGATQVETSTTAPIVGAPGGFEVSGLYYDITTTATFAGPIELRIPYDPAIPDEQALSLRLFHYDTLLVPPSWQDVTQSVDTANKQIVGLVDHFSTFAVGALPVFQGFYQPINMPPLEMSVFKAGSTIPVKFSLGSFFTQENVDDAVATVAVQYLGNDPTAVTVNEAFNTALGDSGNVFRYDPDAQQYIFNLKTKGLQTGLYRIHASLYGGEMEHSVDIRLK